MRGLRAEVSLTGPGGSALSTVGSKGVVVWYQGREGRDDSWWRRRCEEEHFGPPHLLCVTVLLLWRTPAGLEVGEPRGVHSERVEDAVVTRRLLCGAVGPEQVMCEGRPWPLPGEPVLVSEIRLL